jgi:hypothetical protein
MFSSTADPRPAKRTLRASVRRAVDLVVAFATLADELPPHRSVDDLADHPHRLPLRAPSRSRRPGATVSRAQSCTMPAADRPRQRRKTTTLR